MISTVICLHFEETIDLFLIFISCAINGLKFPLYFRNAVQFHNYFHKSGPPEPCPGYREGR